MVTRRRVRSAVRLGVFSCGLLLSSFSSVCEEPRIAPIPFEELLKSNFFPPYLSGSISPDGEWMAFTLINRGRAARFEGRAGTRYWITPSGAPFQLTGADVWIANTKSGEVRNLTGNTGNNWGPVWSPDGECLAFKSDRAGPAAVWVWESSSRRLHQVSSAQVIDTFGGLQWTPDSERILFTVLPAGVVFGTWLDSLGYGPTDENAQYKDSPPDHASVHLVEFAASSNFNKFFCDLAVVDIRTGKLERLLSHIRPLWWRLSATGVSVAAMCSVGETKPGSAQGLFDLWLVEFQRKQPRLLAAKTHWQFGSPISWAPDANSIVFTTGGPESTPTLFRVATNGGNATPLLSSGEEELRSPNCLLWDDTGRHLYATTDHALWEIAMPEGHLRRIASLTDREILSVAALSQTDQLWTSNESEAVILLTNNVRTLNQGFYRVSLKTGEAQLLFEEAKSHAVNPVDHLGMYVSRGGKTVAYVAEDARHPQDLWVLNLEGRTTRLVTVINPVSGSYGLG